MANIYLNSLDEMTNADSFYNKDKDINKIVELLKSGNSIEDIKEIDFNETCNEMLSSLKETTLCWYPFKQNASILEIGGNGGAITGLLCKKADKVCSIEFSRILGELNYYRHLKEKNLQIFTGNPIAFHNKEAFDYVLLNHSLFDFVKFADENQDEGVLLKHLKTLLKKNGRILLLCENRFGIQYLNGVPDKKTGKLFTWMDDLKKKEGYSKNELSQILSENGFFYKKVFYLLPNNQYVQMAIEEDDYTLSSNHFRYFSTFQRLEWFDELFFLNYIGDKTIIGNLMNDYLFEISLEPFKQEVCFVKISADRKDEFKIATRIIKNEKNFKTVEKIPICEKSWDHLLKMSQYYTNYEKDGELINVPLECNFDQKVLTFKYIEGETMEDQLVYLIKIGKSDVFEKEIKVFADQIREGSVSCTDFYTDKFTNVFGEKTTEYAFACKKNANIDMIFSNIIIQNDKKYVIDYEWIFDFNIPVDYIIWRSAFYLLKGNEIIRNKYGISELLKIVDIDYELNDLFLFWENNFGIKYVGGENNSVLENNICNIRNEIQEFLPLKEFVSTIKIFDSANGGDYQTIETIATKKENHFVLKFDLSNVGNNQSNIKWQPIMGPCKVLLSNISTIPETIVHCESINRAVTKKEWDYFITEDPEYQISINGKCKEIKIEGKLAILDKKEIIEAANQKFIEYNQEIVLNQEEIKKLKDFKEIVKTVRKKLVKNVTKTIIDLNKNVQGIKYVIDEIFRKKEGIEIEGWVLDVNNRGPIKIKVLGKNTEEVDIIRFDREDVQHFYHLEKTFNPGFIIKLDKNWLKHEKLFLQFSNESNKTKKIRVNLKNNHAKRNDSDYCYTQWIRKNEEKRISKKRITDMEKWKYRPLISVIIPVYNVEETFLNQCISSVVNQWYPNWELCIADDCSTKDYIKSCLMKWEQRDARIKVRYLERNGHISRASNEAMKLATGEFVALLDHDDLLAPFALYKIVERLNTNPKLDIIYSDEDKITESGRRKDPFFKPDWSPDTLLSQNYVCHFTVIRKKLIEKIGGFEVGMEGAQDHDLVLKCSELTKKINHIPEILYHWRESPNSTAKKPDSKNYANIAGRQAVENALKRRNISGKVSFGIVPGTYTVYYHILGNPKVSILIPTKDHADDLTVCVDSIVQTAGYSNWEIIIIDNGSVDIKTKKCFEYYYQKLKEKFKVISMDIPFNYSKLNNAGAEKASGDYLILMNNDIKMFTPNWLEIMLGYAQQDHIGAVGAKLYFSDDTIQHAGVVLGIGGVAGHSHKYYDRNDYGYFSRLIIPSNYSAVTAALMMVKKDKYFQVKGLNEADLQIAFNDVDFNLKLLKCGYYNICLSQVEAYHFESKSRGKEDTLEKQYRFTQESLYMIDQWHDYLKNDPFYSCNLTREKENFSLNTFDKHKDYNELFRKRIKKIVQNTVLVEER